MFTVRGGARRKPPPSPRGEGGGHAPPGEGLASYALLRKRKNAVRMTAPRTAMQIV